MRRFAFVLLVACKTGAPAPSTTTSAPPTVRVVPPAKAGPETYVVELAPGSPTPIMRGPFVITTINPGGGLVLGMSKDSESGSCTNVVWFEYSGSGAAVGEGEILCARSDRSRTITHGFSGY